MVMWVVDFSSGGYKTKKIFADESTYLLNFENWCSGELSKIGHHFRTKKVIQKLMLSKNVLIHFNEKKSENFRVFLT